MLTHTDFVSLSKYRGQNMRCPRQREASALQARCLEGEKTKQGGQLTKKKKKKAGQFLDLDEI